MRPEILLDIDGVAANFIAGCLPYIKDLTGRDHHHDDVDQFMIEKALGLDDGQTQALYARVASEGWCRALPAYEEAKGGVAELRTFADVIPVTSHFFSGKNWVYERDEWIVEHLGIAKTDIVHTHRKFQIDGDMLIDDKTAHLINWKKRHPRGCAVRLHRRYNAHEEWRMPAGTTEYPNTDYGVVAHDWAHLVRFAKMHFGIDGGSSR